MKVLRAAFTVPIRLLLLACLVLAGWSLWSAGIFDGDVADDLRTSSVYADPGYHLDEAAAERAIGNRRLAVVFADSGDPAEICQDVERAAAGTLVVIFHRDGDAMGSYGCSWLPGSDDENFGNAFVAESRIAHGTSAFADRPLLAVKQVATTYDALARANQVPRDARVIEASAPRYLLAFTALGAVLVGSVVVYLAGRRWGRALADDEAAEIADSDRRSRVDARLSGIAGTLLRLDQKYPGSGGDGRAGDDPASDRWAAQYRAVCAEYVSVLGELNASDEPHADPALVRRVEALAARVDAVAAN